MEEKKVINRKLRIGSFYGSQMKGYCGFIYEYIGFNKEQGYCFRSLREENGRWIYMSIYHHMKSRHFVYSVFYFIPRKEIVIAEATE